MTVWNVGRPTKKLRISSDNGSPIIPGFKQNLSHQFNIETPGPNWKRLSENLSLIVLPIFSSEASDMIMVKCEELVDLDKIDNYNGCESTLLAGLGQAPGFQLLWGAAFSFSLSVFSRPVLQRKESKERYLSFFRGQIRKRLGVCRLIKHFQSYLDTLVAILIKVLNTILRLHKFLLGKEKVTITRL